MTSPSPSRLTPRRKFSICSAVAAVMVLAFLLVPLLLPFDPNVTDLSRALLPPGSEGFLLGSDAVGRDVLLRVLYGGSESVVMSFAIVGLSFAIGIAVGLTAGFAGGVVDEILDKIITMFQAFPSFVLAIAIAAILGQGALNLIIAVTLAYWTQPARLARSLAMSLKSSSFVRSARMCGAGAIDIMRKYLLPNMLSPMVVMAALSIGDVILTMAGLAFLGLGPERPSNEWGAMMSEARSSFQYAPWGILVPGVALFLTVTVFNLLGDFLRDVLDVRMLAQEERRSDLSGGSSNDDGNHGKRERKHMDLLKRKAGILATCVAVCTAFCLVITGCSASQGSKTPGELHAGSSAYFYNETCDPAYNWDGWELGYYGVAENLLKLSDDFKVEPWLAESCESVDELTWKLTLRDDVTFSNGEKMTADSVKSCLERTFKENPRASETLDVDSITADGQTLTIKTKQAVPSFENVICDPLFCVYYTGDDVDYATSTPCTGPYVVTDFVFEDHVTLEPNENYWDGTPKLKSITLKTFFDDDAMTAAMQSGELDALAMPGMSSYATLSKDNKFKVSSQDSSRADFVRFNMKHPVVAEPAVRLAVSYCIDREGYAKTICNGNETASYGVYSSQLPYGGTEGLDVTVSSCDTDAAAKALDEAGIVDHDGDGIRELKDGTPCVINLFNCATYDRFVDIADDLQSKLKQVGIDLKINNVDYWLQDDETYAKDDPDMTIDSYGMAPTGDADYFASMCFASTGSSNFGKYENEEVDALIKELEATFDAEKRDDITKQISQKVLDDNAYIFFGNSKTCYLSANYVSGFAVAPSEYYFITKDTTVE